MWLEKPDLIYKMLLYGLANINLTSGEYAIETIDNAWYLCINGGIKFFFYYISIWLFCKQFKSKKI